MVVRHDEATGHPIKSGMVDDNAKRVHIYWPIGFHGDPNLLKVVDDLTAKVTQFVEAGTDTGSTTGYAARMYPHMSCYTVEVDPGTFKAASLNLVNHGNITMENQHSLDFLSQIPADDIALFWLDAHSHGWGCSLGKEAAIVLERWHGGYILMDDFHVPGRDDYGFDWYDGYKLDWDTILQDIPEEFRSNIHSIHYPNYEPPFGTRGWVLIQFGDAPAYKAPSYLTTFKQEA